VRDLTVRFTRTTAPLGQFSEGYVTLRGPTRVRVPVALRPVAVGAQQEVTGRGADGTARITGTAGFTGDLDVKVTGLARAASASGTVAAGADDLYCVTTSDTTRALRVDLDAGDGAGGLDLAGFRLRGGCASDAVDHLATSRGPAADESFTVLDPAPGSYLLQVRGAAAGGEKRTGYRLDVVDVDDSTSVGGLRAEPDPVPVLTGRPVAFRVAWAGLDPGSRYLGVLEYAGAPTPTYLTVDTGKP
jgi:hypothetical protein